MRSRFAALLGFCVLFAACKSNDRNKTIHGSNTVVIGMTSDFDSFLELTTANSDALHVIEEMLFLTLNELDENLDFQPRLAKSWQISEDGKTIQCQLREDVYWSDGQQTTAEDVFFTFQLANNPKTGYAARGRFSQLDTVEVIGRHSVKFIFKSVSPDALHDLQIPILPKHLLENVAPEEIRQTGFNRRPVGNGPYKLKEWRANDRVVFEANENYYAGKPQITRIVFRIVPDETVLLTGLLTGDIDVLPYLSPNKLDEINGHPQYQIIRYPDRGYTFLAFNLERAIFKDVRVRKAIAKAINRNDLIQALLNGNGRQIAGPILPYFSVYDASLAKNLYEPNLAATLLQEAGWQDANKDNFLENNGTALEFSMKTNADNKLRSDALVMIQNDLQKVGIRANIELVEAGKLVEDVLQRRDFDTVLLAWKTGYTVNPAQIWHSDAIKNGYNLGAYRQPVVDSLLTAARSETNPQNIKQIWQHFQRVVAGDYPYVFLYMQENPAIVHKRIRNIKMDVRGYLPNIEQWVLE